MYYFLECPNLIGLLNTDYTTRHISQSNTTKAVLKQTYLSCSIVYITISPLGFFSSQTALFLFANHNFQ